MDMTLPEPQKEHQWLQKFVGEWTGVSEMPCEPGKEPQKFETTEIIRSLGGIWFVGESNGAMPDGKPAISIITLGYDPQKQRFVGSWIGTMMTNFWIYEGTLDAEAGVLTLESEGPDCTTPGKTGKYRDVVTLKSDDHRVLTSYTQQEDGSWEQFMTMDYYRKK